MSANEPTDRSGKFFIALASDPKNPYPAGYDGNVFDTRVEAESACVSQRELGGEFDVEWVVSQY
jgi:hypothetical protein